MRNLFFKYGFSAERFGGFGGFGVRFVKVGSEVVRGERGEKESEEKAKERSGEERREGKAW